ncbi:nuclear transport factor 2 family protein [Conexibacter sp. JD483]|uniref:nuclear transport factor 2 family protein n=1 Tax=unclassified Conexibacter TaxID=2627773 RepID=UPI00271B14B6|nr:MULTISPECIES: nuclear transport factor 2 family protein [unclassified Conexibacter]MDO8188355.1 nuclear transport factor 2 family protein [Conexibacter sp. CPCC 205706]MDO8201101.1 nuclear transport factor 2 family protein [Conexibacter sp. CPCC 205762]MDR9372155.1 nuclear transport factor 2 family protein [Conexibacter sp. JD483]
MASEMESTTATAAYCAAVDAGDLEALRATLAPGVTLKSPITDSFEFSGREQVLAVMREVFVVTSERRFSADAGDARQRVLTGHAKVRGVALDESVHVTLDEAGLITRLVLFIRPLPALTTLAAELGPRVARQNSPARAVAVRAMLGPLAFMMRSGEKLGARLAHP